MPMNGLKAYIQVMGGVIPGQPLREHMRRWDYTSGDYERDRNMPPSDRTVFSTMLDEAHEYAKGLSNPAYLNWVRVEWVWV